MTGSRSTPFASASRDSIPESISGRNGRTCSSSGLGGDPGAANRRAGLDAEALALVQGPPVSDAMSRSVRQPRASRSLDDGLGERRRGPGRACSGSTKIVPTQPTGPYAVATPVPRIRPHPPRRSDAGRCADGPVEEDGPIAPLAAPHDLGGGSECPPRALAGSVGRPSTRQKSAISWARFASYSSSVTRPSARRPSRAWSFAASRSVPVRRLD